MKNYYLVTCKCGHTGSKKTYIPMTFAVCAQTGREAAAMARNFPRVKHHQKFAILSVEQCSYREYKEQAVYNEGLDYFNCHSIQEQRMLGIEDQYVYEDEEPKMTRKELLESERERTPYYYGKEQIRNAKKFARMNY